MTKRKLIEYGLLAIFLVSVVGVIISLPVEATTTYHYLPTTPAPTRPALRQDPEVVTVMQRLGLDYSKLNLIYEQAPDSPAGTEGMFVSPNTLYVTPGQQLNSIDTIISHEYIHDVQHNIDHSGAQSFYPYLNQLATTDSWLHDRMAWHRDHYCTTASCTLEPEYEAVACTEMPDRALQADFITWCNTYLPKRYSLTL